MVPPEDVGLRISVEVALAGYLLACVRDLEEDHLLAQSMGRDLRVVGSLNAVTRRAFADKRPPQVSPLRPRKEARGDNGERRRS